MAELHAAYVYGHGIGQFFLSPDGENYIGTNLPQLGLNHTEKDIEQMREQVLKLMAGENIEKDGQKARTIPMRYARRWFTTIIPQDEKTSDVCLYRWDGSKWATDRDIKFHGELNPDEVKAQAD